MDVTLLKALVDGLAVNPSPISEFFIKRFLMFRNRLRAIL